MTDKEKILAEIERLKKDWQCYLRYSVESKYRTEAYTELLDFINSLPEEPVNNSDWLLELQDKLDNATPEQLEELWNKYHDEEEPVSEDLEEAARKYFKSLRDYCFIDSDIILAFKTGAQWQKQVFEKNRLAACDRATKEEIEREQDFVDKVLLGEHRQPTFSDAIEYGMRLQKQQTIDKACMYLNEHREGFITDDYIKELRKALEED